jgi:hypothetical protein
MSRLDIYIRDADPPGIKHDPYTGQYTVAGSSRTSEGKRQLHIVHGVPGTNHAESHVNAAEYLKSKGHKVTSTWTAGHTASASPGHLKALQEGRFLSHHYEK